MAIRIKAEILDVDWDGVSNDINYLSIDADTNICGWETKPRTRGTDEWIEGGWAGDGNQRLIVTNYDKLLVERPEAAKRTPKKFKLGDRVRKIKGSEWQGVVVGEYSTSLNPEGYCVESEDHAGSVQLYPSRALELVPTDDT